MDPLIKSNRASQIAKVFQRRKFPMQMHLPLESTGTYRELETARLYTYRWDRQGRKGQLCKVTARGKFNSIRVEFADGYTMITSGNAIRRAVTPSPALAAIENGA